jgi:type IV secretion system protein VirB6
MFDQLGAWISLFTSGYVNRVVSTLATGLTPVALIWLTVYIANYGYAVVRGEVQEPVSVFMWKMFKMMLILTFALGSARYMSFVSDTANGLQDGMATIFLQGDAGFSKSAPVTVFGALDSANNQANDLLKQIWRDAGMWRLDLVVASVTFSLGTVLFLVLGAFVALLSKVILTFALAIGPAAILCLMFKPSAKFFDSWLSLLMSAIVLAWFVFFALGLSFFVVQKLLVGFEASGAFSAAGSANALEAAGTYLTFMVLLAILLYQSPQLASALTGGPSLQTGAQIAAAGLAAAKIFGSKGGGAGAGGGSTGGGSIRSGGGAGYAAGRASGVVGRAGLQAAGAAGNAAATSGRAAVTAGQWAYQRVAQMGKRS